LARSHLCWITRRAILNEKVDFCYSGSIVRAVHAPDHREKGGKMKKYVLAAFVLAAVILFPAVTASAHGDGEYCPADDAYIECPEPVREEPPQQAAQTPTVRQNPPQAEPGPTAIVDITPQDETTITVIDHIGEYEQAVNVPPQQQGGPSHNPFTPSGTGTTVDNATDGDGKEFFTIMTPDENVFYLVIDRQRNGENVYLLNAVTEADLLSLAKMPERPAPPVVEPPPAPAEPEPEPEPEKKSGGGMLVMVLVILIGGGGAGWYFKIYRPKQQGGGAVDYDAEDYSEDDYSYSDEPDAGPDGDYSDDDSWDSEEIPPDGDDGE
jgi:hypothetical protein